MLLLNWPIPRRILALIYALGLNGQMRDAASTSRNVLPFVSAALKSSALASEAARRLTPGLTWRCNWSGIKVSLLKAWAKNTVPLSNSEQFVGRLTSNLHKSQQPLHSSGPNMVTKIGMFCIVKILQHPIITQVTRSISLSWCSR